MLFGYNYHPSESGCYYWTNWNYDEINNDFRIMSENGMDIVRFFIFWTQFEKQEGNYDDVLFERLHLFVKTAKRYGLMCLPSILTIWMNGQLFDLPWRKGRSLWSDAYMIDKQAEFIQRVVDRIKNCGNIFAYDLGDEMLHIHTNEIETLDKNQAMYWLTRMSKAVRFSDPTAKMIMSNDYLVLLAGRGMNIQTISGYTDYAALHGFPNWSPFNLASNRSFASLLYTPFLVKVAKLYGLPFVDEFGLYGSSEGIRADYVFTVGISCWLQGAEGLVAWCWKDFSTINEPYYSNPVEASMGFYKADGAAKISADKFIQCKEWIRQLNGFDADPAKIAVYIPNYTGQSIDYESKDHKTKELQALFSCFVMLQTLHIPHEFVSNQLSNYTMVFVPSVRLLKSSDMDKLKEYVKNGGNVYCSAASWNVIQAGEELWGVSLEDFSTGSEEEGYSFTYHDRTYYFGDGSLNKEKVPVVQNYKAEVMAYLNDSHHPALTIHSYGKGKVLFLSIPFELNVYEKPARYLKDYACFYRDLLQEFDLHPAVLCSLDDVEIHVLRKDPDEEVYVFINHSEKYQAGEVIFRSSIKKKVSLQRKSVNVIKIPRVVSDHAIVE
jgi:endo-1,4-beta-mannosidase